MGLIKAAFQAVGGNLRDQYLEFFTCDSLGQEVLLRRGAKVMRNGSNKGDAEIISNGSKIAVPEGTALILVDNGRVVDFTTEAGMYTWDTSSAPTCFGTSGFLNGVKKSCADIWNRIKAGGEALTQQRVYFVNMLEMVDNKFGTAAPLPYDDPTYRGIYIRMNGTFSFKIVDPVTFFKNIAGNVSGDYRRDELMGKNGQPGQAKAEFLMYLGEALNKMGAGGEEVQYNRLQSQQVKLAKYMNEVLDEDWLQGRGMIVEKVAVMSVTPDDESRKRIQDMDDGLMFGNNPQMAAGYQIKGSVDAMKTAAGNQAGAGNAMMGLGLVGGFNGSAMNPGNQGMAFLQQQQMMQQQQQMQQAAAPAAAAGWACACGATGNQGKFCAECGKPKPVEDAGWTCECGATGNKGKFCAECGKPKPVENAGWTCPKCGATGNSGKFCGECGEPKP
ncbi:MAG TPA: hypothetical protein DEG74_02510 [Clostridiales bacterium]|nr:SPFH domain-containing protein [Saccharofermentanaceae bacterium]HBY32622.1 hypothetical protein [Clostridiales bacterium]